VVAAIVTRIRLTESLTLHEAASGVCRCTASCPVRWFRRHARAAGLPAIRLHDMRHSYATAGLAAGVPPR